MVLRGRGFRNGNCPKQIPHKLIEFGIGNEVRRLHAKKPDQRPGLPHAKQ
jgi:hypothetical protein